MSMSEQSHLFCFGYGYCCDYLGRVLETAGNWRLSGTTRDPNKKALMKEHNIKAYVFDHDMPLDDARRYMNGVTHLLISTPPDDRGDPAFIIHGEDIASIPTLRWVGYLSSTAVYGDRTGEWVDENSELRPNSKRGTRRAIAEQQWMSLYRDEGVPVHIFRLAGIYGPMRSALDSVRAGVARRINKPGHAFSRIHIDDIVQTLVASMSKPNPGAIYNLADDRAAPSHEVIKYACDLLGLEPPPLMQYDEADMAPITRSFYADNKRVKNERIKRDLDITLKHPDYMSGLRACLDAEKKGIQSCLVSFADGESVSG